MSDPYRVRVRLRPEIAVALKVPLERNAARMLRPNGGILHFNITRAFPLFRASQGLLIHRVRRAVLIVFSRGRGHVGVDYWCSNTGTTTTGRFLANRTSGEPNCLTCEDAAVKAGRETIAAINDRCDRVIFPESAGARRLGRAS